MLRIKLFFILLTLFQVIRAEENGKVFKMCVPERYLKDCKDLLPYIKEHDPQMECIIGYNRFGCLEMLQNNEADVIALDTEDIFFAAGMDKGTFKIIAELRKEEDDMFEDEDQILIRKSSTIKNLKDLKGLKSCHPSFNSYYGYKIPISILYQLGILEISKDPSIPVAERELQALSNFYEQSCIVGPYSDDENIDEEWKKKYPNLCQLCENSDKCDSDDKYANYDGPIECLINGGGDIAFTRRSDIRQYFGLTNEGVNNDIDINDYELLCEDSSRRPINGTGCSLAKRPNRAYLTTTNITNDKSILNNLLLCLKTFFKNGLDQLKYSDRPKKLFIEDDMKLHVKPIPVSPYDYTNEVKKYFERDESYTYKVKICVTTDIELEKCEILAKLGFLYELRPGIECYFSQQNDCAAEVSNGNADIVFIPGYNWAIIDDEYKKLKRIHYENWIFNETYIAIVSGYQTLENVLKYPIKFDNSDKRAYKAACLLHLILGRTDDCENLNGNIIETNDYIQIVNSTYRHRYGRDKVLLCLDKSRSHIGDYYFCNLDKYYQKVAYANRNKSEVEINSYKSIITSFGSLFADEGAHATVFDIYGPFKGIRDVLINAITLDFIDGLPNFDTLEEEHRDLIMKLLKYNWDDNEKLRKSND